MRGLSEALGQLRTTRIRASRIEIPDVKPPEPEELAEAAAQPDALPQLKALAAAVDAGTMTWEQIIERGVAQSVTDLENPPADDKSMDDDEYFSQPKVTDNRGW